MSRSGSQRRALLVALLAGLCLSSALLGLTPTGAQESPEVGSPGYPVGDRPSHAQVADPTPQDPTGCGLRIFQPPERPASRVWVADGVDETILRGGRVLDWPRENRAGLLPPFFNAENEPAVAPSEGSIWPGAFDSLAAIAALDPADHLGLVTDANCFVARDQNSANNTSRRGAVVCNLDRVNHCDLFLVDFRQRITRYLTSLDLGVGAKTEVVTSQGVLWQHRDTVSLVGFDGTIRWSRELLSWWRWWTPSECDADEARQMCVAYARGGLWKQTATDVLRLSDGALVQQGDWQDGVRDGDSDEPTEFPAWTLPSLYQSPRYTIPIPGGVTFRLNGQVMNARGLADTGSVELSGIRPNRWTKTIKGFRGLDIVGGRLYLQRSAQPPADEFDSLPGALVQINPRSGRGTLLRRTPTWTSGRSTLTTVDFLGVVDGWLYYQTDTLSRIRFPIKPAFLAQVKD